MSVLEQAKYELKLINFGEEDIEVMVKILEMFFKQWDSGGAVAVASKVLARCIAGKPLSPLTGNDDEWMEVTTNVYQNIRCGTVFKDNGRPYDIDVHGRPTITFPYTPLEYKVHMPIMEITDED